MNKSLRELLRVNNIKKKEFESYLTKFKRADVKYFSAIKVGGGCLTDELVSNVVDSLTELHDLGLYPLVVHGGGKQIDEAMESEGMTSAKIDGKRVTNERTLGVVVETLININTEFVSKLNKFVLRAEGLQ